MNHPNKPPSASGRFRVIRFHLSKGDIAFEETVAVFNTEAEAQACPMKNRTPPPPPAGPIMTITRWVR